MKKFIGLGISLLLLAGISGIGTWAYFGEVETSSNSVFAAGTLDLKTNDLDGVSQTLFATNLAPADTVGPETLILKNAGSLPGGSLDLAFSYVESDSNPNPVNMNPAETAAVIEITTLAYDGSSLLGDISDSNANGYKDVYDLSTANLSGKAGIGAYSSKIFEIAVRLRSDIDKGYQADGINVTMNFVLNQ